MSRWFPKLGYAAAMRLGLVLALAGCLHEIRTTPLEIEAARQPVLAGRSVAVRSQRDGMIELAPRSTIEVVTAHGERFTLALDSVMHDCPDHASGIESNRLCEFHDIDHVVIGHRRDVKTPLYTAAVTTAVLTVLTGAGAMVYCAAECDREVPRRLSQIGSGALAGLLIYVAFRSASR